MIEGRLHGLADPGVAWLFEVLMSEPPAEGGGGGTPYLWMQKLSAARYIGEFSMACGILIAPLLSGSGKFVEPWARIH